MHRILRLAAALAVVAAATVLGAGPAAAADTGSISGTITSDLSGAPVGGVRVALNRVSTGTWAAKVNATATGTYSITGLAAGQYRIWFIDYADNFIDEWHANAATASTATMITVGAGPVTINGALTPVNPNTGSIGGTVTDSSNGSPLAGVRVSLSSVATGSWVGHVNASAAGSYSFTGLAPGQYRVFFNDNNDVYTDEWHHDAPTAASATLKTVAGLPLTVNESMVRTNPIGLPGRDLDPVVFNGAAIPSLIGRVPGDVVAFRYTGAAWAQVPVQVDERHWADLKKLRDGSGTMGVSVLAYSDSTSNAGADPTTTFDSDDELVFMAGDTGPRSPLTQAAPSGVNAGTRVDVRVTDPLNGSAEAFVSLFARVGTSLSPGAGANYVTYTFAPITSTTENTNIQTDHYRTHFSGRWIRDILEIEAPYGNGADVLDRHRMLFGPGVCTRSEDTFTTGGGGFATNRDGPVRAIRSYLGANSGTYTQREHVFYRAHEVTTTFLRVHSIPGIMDFWDYSPAATGMTYANNLAPAGVTINGTPDSVPTGALAWERVDGTQGGIIQAHQAQTNIAGLVQSSYYQDDSTPPSTQCTGDSFEYGASGPWITSNLPNTDPASPPASSLTSTRRTAYRGAGTTAATTSSTVSQLNTGLVGALAP